MAGYAPAVVVGIGYRIDAPIDVVWRNYDYTPPTGPAPEYDDRNPGRLAGGAEVFTGFLRQRLIPELVRRVPGASGPACLFGHSYGGLYAVYCFLRAPGLYSAVAAASPSLWYRKGHVLQLAAQVADGPRPAGRLLLTVGQEEQEPDAEEAGFLGPQRSAAMRVLKQVDNLRALGAQLSAQGIDTSALVFPGETHASVVPGAISRAVRFFLHRLPRPDRSPP